MDTIVEATGKDRNLLWTENKETHPMVITSSIFFIGTT
jgi:hypothetical protein